MASPVAVRFSIGIKDTMAIYFYTAHGSYGALSNFSAHGFFLERHHWKTAEHYFQAQKFLDSPYFDLIRLSKNPKEASLLGKSRKYKIRKDWDQIRDHVMRKAVKKKFENHPALQMLLIETGDENLI